MKVLRFLLIGAGILVALLGILLGLALTSSVQTWAAKRIIAGDPSLGVVQLGRVSAGFERIEISDVKIVRPGLSLTLPSATVELPLLAALSNKIDIRRLDARGWTLELSDVSSGAVANPASVSSTGAVAAFEGVFQAMELPVDLSVESADLAGVVIFPVKSGHAPGRAELIISGGQLAVGREGRFTIKADAVLPHGAAPVSRLNSISTLSLRMDTPRTFGRVGVTNETNATGPGLPQGARLLSESSASREADRETYELLVKSQVSGGEKKLIALSASNPSAKTPITGTWAVDLGDVDIAPFTLGRTLPPFTLSSTGSFQTDRGFREVRLTGKSDLIVEKLDSVYAGLSALGRVQVIADFDGVHRSTGVRVNRLSMDVVGKSPVVSVQALQALEIVPATGEIKVAAPDTDLVKISLTGLPLAWARPFIPENVSITSDDLRGEFVARAHNGGFAVRSLAPLVVGDLSVSQDGKALIQTVDISVAATGDYSPAGWQADVSEITARSRGADLLTLSLRAGQSTGIDQPVKATGRLRADLPALMAQPVAAGFSVLAQGEVEAEFTASVAPALRQVSSKLVLSKLRAKDGETLPVLSTDLRADQHNDGRMEINLPLVFDLSGRKSDVEITGSVKPDGGRWAVDAQVLSREIYLDDLKSLAALQPVALGATSEKPATPVTTTPAPLPDNKPVWDAITGQIKLALKKVVYASAQPPVEISTSVKISPGMLTLESLNAVFPNGANAKADGAIQFQPATPEPYDVNASVSVTGLDPQPFLAAANPGKPPTVEGKFDLTGKVSGRTPSLDKFADKANLDAQMVSRGGRFHGFATSALAANLGKGQENISKLASAVSLIGGALGKGDLARDAERFRAGSDSIRRLVDFNFDQLNIDIAHRPGESVTQIKNFSLISPDLRLLGGGTIDNTPGVSVFQRALNLDLQMAVRGAQADDLRILNVLKNEADALGYTAISENFPVNGTLSSMTIEPLIRKLTSQIKP